MFNCGIICNVAGRTLFFANADDDLNPFIETMPPLVIAYRGTVSGNLSASVGNPAPGFSFGGSGFIRCKVPSWNTLTVDFAAGQGGSGNLYAPSIIFLAGEPPEGSGLSPGGPCIRFGARGNPSSYGYRTNTDSPDTFSSDGNFFSTLSDQTWRTLRIERKPSDLVDVYIDDVLQVGDWSISPAGDWVYLLGELGYSPKVRWDNLLLKR